MSYLQEADSSLVDYLVLGLPLLSCLNALKYIVRYVPTVTFLGKELL